MSDRHEVEVWSQFAKLEVTSSTTHETFKAHDIQHVQPTPRPRPRTTPPFEGQSSYSQDYVNHKVAFLAPSLQINKPLKRYIPFQGTTTTQESFTPHQALPGRPAVGIGVKSGLLKVIIPPNAVLPAVGREIFTNVKDGQDEIRFKIYQGFSPHADKCQLIGEFCIRGLKTGRAGSARIQVGVRLLQNGSLEAQARDLSYDGEGSVSWAFKP
jgi:Hsp70 protein